MKSFSQFLNEMPINKFQLVGDWGPDDPKRHWDKASIGILTSPKGVEKIKNMWSSSEVDFDMYFIRQKGASQFDFVGEVDSNWLKQNLNIDLQANPEAITVLFTQNKSAEKVPMTAWTIGHRLGHSFLASGLTQKSYTGILYNDFRKKILKEFEDVLLNAYGQRIQKSYSFADADGEKKLRYLAIGVGTMKSARTGSLARFDEFTHELFGQYVLTGKIRFNTPPKGIGVQSNWGRVSPKYNRRMNNEEELKELDYIMRGLAEQFDLECERVLHSAVGHIFVV